MRKTILDLSDDLPELIKDSETYKKAQEYMMSGGSIDVIKQKYSVSQEVEVALIKSI